MESHYIIYNNTEFIIIIIDNIINIIRKNDNIILSSYTITRINELLHIYHTDAFNLDINDDNDIMNSYNDDVLFFRNIIELI